MTSKKHYHSGFDYFTPEVGEHQSMYCNACNEEMSVKRDQEIFSSRYPAVGTPSSQTRRVDIFSCPHAGTEWHDQVIALRRFQRDTPSKTLSDLVEPEIQEIITTKIASKSSWGFA